MSLTQIMLLPTIVYKDNNGKQRTNVYAKLTSCHFKHPKNDILQPSFTKKQSMLYKKQDQNLNKIKNRIFSKKLKQMIHQ